MKKGKQGEGGGRPPKPAEERKQSLSITLPPEQIAWLKRQGSASETIRNLIQDAMKKPGS